MDSILRIGEVVKQTGLSRSSVYRQVQLGQFPAPFKISARASGWLGSDVQRWMEKKRAEASGNDVA